MAECPSPGSLWTGELGNPEWIVGGLQAWREDELEDDPFLYRDPGSALGFDPEDLAGACRESHPGASVLDWENLVALAEIVITSLIQEGRLE